MIKILSHKEGDSLTPNEARKVMEEADLNNDKKLDYREFAKLVVNTIEKTKKIARKRMRTICKHLYLLH